jgi:hypothetical protein
MIYSTPDGQKYIDIHCMYSIVPAAADIDIPLDVQKAGSSRRLAGLDG